MLGSFPIIFGLSFRDALLATLLGLVLGAAILAPMALFGPRNGTNNAVSSSAHLGVHGRVVGSFLSLLTAVAFFSISVWSSGDVLVGGANRAIGLPDNDFAVGVAYGIFALLVLVVCIYGFRFMLLVNKIAVIAATVLFLLGIFAFAGTFDPGYAGIFGPDADAATNALFWPSFVGAALIVMSNPVSFGAFLGDWARYIPRETPAWKSMSAAFLAQIATLVPFLFGLVTATVVATNAPDVLRRGQLRRRSAGRLAGLVLRAGLPDRPDRWHVDRHHRAVRHRARLLQRVPAVQPGAGDGVHRRHRDRVHLRRPVRLQCGAEHFDVRRADRHVHGAVDGRDDDRLVRPPRLV